MSSPGSQGAFLVVGAGPGVGLAAARRFGREGHPVGLVARTGARSADLARVLEREDLVAAAAPADITDPAALHGAVTALRERLGPVEALLFSPRPDTAWIRPVLETTAPQLGAALGLSVLAAATAVQAVLPDMLAAGRGTLLFTTGGAAAEPHPDRAVSGVAYAAEAVYVGMLHDALAGQGVHAARVTVFGAVGPGLCHEPEAVAEELWRRHRLRDRAVAVLR